MGRQGITHARPRGLTFEQMLYYERTPKHILFDILMDFAIQEIGQDIADSDKGKILDEIERRETIVKRLQSF